MEMSVVQVLELVLNQIGELRIPFKDRVLREQVEAIVENIQLVKCALESPKEEKPEEEEVVEDVQR